MEKKQRPPAHEGFRHILKISSSSFDEIKLIVYFYGELDIICPPKAIPDVIEDLKLWLKNVSLESMIKKAVSNLWVQLEEYEASQVVSKDIDKEPVPADEEGFKNPKTPWDYVGKFSLKLRPSTSGPSGMVLKFKSDASRIDASGSGIVVNANGKKDLVWQWRDIETIRNGEGKLLWKRKKNRRPIKLLPSPQLNADLSRHLGLDRSSNL